MRVLNKWDQEEEIAGPCIQCRDAISSAYSVFDVMKDLHDAQADISRMSILRFTNPCLCLLPCPGQLSFVIKKRLLFRRRYSVRMIQVICDPADHEPPAPPDFAFEEALMGEVRTPPSAGQFLKTSMELQGLTVGKVSEMTGVGAREIEALFSGERKIDRKLADRLEPVIPHAAESLLRVQYVHEFFLKYKEWPPGTLFERVSFRFRRIFSPRFA